MAIPSAGELPRIGLRLLRQVLIHGREGETGVEVGGVPRVGEAEKIGVVVAEFVAQTAVVLNVGGEGRFAERKFARDFPISRFDSLVGVVHVDEEEGVTPTVGTEHFDRGGPVGTIGLFLVVKLTAEVVVQLDVLSLCGTREGREEHEEEKHECGAHGGK